MPRKKPHTGDSEWQILFEQEAGTEVKGLSSREEAELRDGIRELEHDPVTARPQAPIRRSGPAGVYQLRLKTMRLLYAVDRRRRRVTLLAVVDSIEVPPTQGMWWLEIGRRMLQRWL